MNWGSLSIDDVVFWVSQCIEEAKLQTPLLSRAQGLHGSDMSWRRLQQKTDEHGSRRAPEGPAPIVALPARGERKRKRDLRFGGEAGDREAAGEARAGGPLPSLQGHFGALQGSLPCRVFARLRAREDRNGCFGEDPK